MNKYMGFYEMKDIGIPAVNWQKFHDCTELDDGLLWSIRVAVENNSDINLPRLIGATACEAENTGRNLLEKFDCRGMVIYYPYFIAEKSGVLEISSSRTVVEAVRGDLWNLTTHGRNKDVTVISDSNGTRFVGNSSFFNSSELEELFKSARRIKGRFRDEITEGRSLLAEWSFAYNTDTRRKPVGDRYLVFYELRSI